MDGRGIPADASAVIYLAKAGGLAAASACFGPLIMAPAVWEEVVERGGKRGSADVPLVLEAEKAGHVRKVILSPAQDRRVITQFEEFQLGPGETEMLALASDHGWVLVDDLRATRASQQLGIQSVGTIVVPAVCVQTGVLEPEAGRELLYGIARHTTVRADMLRRVEQMITEARA